MSSVRATMVVVDSKSKFNSNSIGGGGGEEGDEEGGGGWSSEGAPFV